MFPELSYPKIWTTEPNHFLLQNVGFCHLFLSTQIILTIVLNPLKRKESLYSHTCHRKTRNTVKRFIGLVTEVSQPTYIHRQSRKATRNGREGSSNVCKVKDESTENFFRKRHHFATAEPRLSSGRFWFGSGSCCGPSQMDHLQFPEATRASRRTKSLVDTYACKPLYHP